MKSIFISYCHAEVKVIRNLVLKLAEDHNLWVDQRLQAGELFDYTIKESIVQCDVFVLFLSTYYAKSDYCLKELELANSLKKTSSRSGLMMKKRFKIKHTGNRCWNSAANPTT